MMSQAGAVRAADLEVERLGKGPPVLFIHGDIVGPESTWRKQRPLAERWRLIIPNRPGFGQSPPLERKTSRSRRRSSPSSSETGRISSATPTAR